MEEGAIVHVDYDLYDGASGDLIETTRAATAKEHEVHQEGREYSPMVCVVGGGNLIPGFETALLEAKADTDIDITIPAEEAYGEKDPAQMETISRDKLLRSVRDPNQLYIGAPVNIGGRQGYLSYVAAGRCRIDYNHPMAGKDLRYSFRIVKVVEGREATVEALLQSNTGHSDFGVKFEGDDVWITLPQSMLFDTNAAMMKFSLVRVLRDAMDDLGVVTFLEVHQARGIGHVHNHDDHDHDHDHDHDEDLDALSVSDLKERCKAAGLPVGGKKSDLIERLRALNGEEE
jgi:FKBP-type peptidyl-prolyl cis-trans isomerase 2